MIALFDCDRGRSLGRRLLIAALPILILTGSGCPNSPPKLVVVVTGSGNGKVTGSTSQGPIDCSIGTIGACSGSLNNLVTLTATAGLSTRFVGWSGCSTATTPVLVVSGTQATFTGPDTPPVATCTATFHLEQVTVSVAFSGSGGGMVTSTPQGLNCSAGCAALFDSSSTVTLTATPNSNSTFGGWSGGLFCPSPINRVLTFTALASVTCTVRFDLTGNPIIIADDFDDAGASARWDVTRTATGGASSSESITPSGGVPTSGAYREGRHDFTSVGTAAATHILRGDFTHLGRYDPAVSGAVDHLVVSMDRRVLHAPNVGAQTGTSFALRQGSSVFTANLDPGGFFNNLAWLSVTKTLVPSDFSGVDFNAPMEFGFRHSVTASSGSFPLFLTWGVDNFRVEVWHH